MTVSELIEGLKKMPQDAEIQIKHIEQSETWRYDKPPIEENVIVSCRDETGDTPYNYTSVGWYFDGLWVVDNAPCSCVIAWKELPKPLT